MSAQAVVSVTDRAAKKVREFFAREGDGEALLRISLVRTHCMGGRGYGYRMSAERSPRAEDVTQDSQGLSLVVDRKEAPRLAGAIVDYVDELDQSGFLVQNPQSLSKCPCGHHDLFE